MLKTVSIKKFKSLKDVELVLSDVNILAGLNGSGKSSFIQGIMHYRRALAGIDLLNSKNLMQEPNLSGIALHTKEPFDLGVGKDIFYQCPDGDDFIEFSITDHEGHCVSSRFKYDIESDVLYAEDVVVAEERAVSTLNFNRWQYVNTEHISPRDNHVSSDDYMKRRDIGNKGEYVINYLVEFGTVESVDNVKLQHPKARTDKLLHEVDAWLGEVSPGVKLVARHIENLDQLRLAYKFETDAGYSDEVKPINTGFGISYVLPVIVAILKAQRGDIVIIENPESHLHPRGQSILGKMVACAASDGVQFIIETHSDHFINGVRVAVREGLIQSAAAKLFYFDRIKDGLEQYSIVQKINIDKNGELSDYPKGFLDEWTVQLMKLI